MDSRKTGLQGTDHPVSASSLENMARSRFGQLTDGELKLVRAAPRGEQAACGPVDISCVQLADMPKHLEKSGKECEIRAALVRWLCTDNEAKRLVSPDGKSLYSGISNARAIFSKVSTDGTVCPFSTREM
jgi:hypothetical protein